MELKEIGEIALKAGIDERYISRYGRYKAKVDLSINEEIRDNPEGKLILVSAITPTKSGEGKTTVSIALADGFASIGEKALLCLREPSLGPVFGIKGGATGGGKATVEPHEDINLHFNGDMHALTSSINLIAACIDNHIYQGNELGIDPERILWPRALDMNDRALREVEVALGDKKGTPHKNQFVITVASELMAIMCLAKDEDDFLERVSRIMIAYDYEGNPLTVKDLRITHAIMRLMKEALNPNLVQTGEGNPGLMHGGPFANIAHGCNSLIATKMALKLSPVVITEAGFGADLGAEKFLDIACREGNMKPSLCVLVATIKALKLHGGAAYEDLAKEDLDALRKGIPNLRVHIENIKKFGLPVLVAINHFETDSEKEIELLSDWCDENNIEYSFTDSFLKGGIGAADLASKAKRIIDEDSANFHHLYELDLPLEKKIEKIAREIYRADGVIYEGDSLSQLKECERLGFSDAYVCMAKTPASLSDDASLLGVPEHFDIHIKEVRLSAGARFVVPLTGKIFTMPGLPKIPAAVKMEDEPWR